jgi:hypothetical protein
LAAKKGGRKTSCRLKEEENGNSLSTKNSFRFQSLTDPDAYPAKGWHATHE